ncbi:ribosomal protein L20-like protein [Leptospira interrogans serovar Bataviae str. HAI135]|nr:ribosomal protein L20-like protein [Leptospira interrogans serovar Bataviae str. HAI135]
MPRAVNGTIHKNRRKKILKDAKGFRGARSKLYRTAKSAVMKAGQWAYRDRRAKKEIFVNFGLSELTRLREKMVCLILYL